ncbi:MAG: ParB/RepB/Spo0J family partition protein [Elusimicrobiota bacterium]|nr:ParB/RepB/Spo0J family partition protein [Elusimicrobiota bacterium]
MKKHLGKGLEALISDIIAEPTVSTVDKTVKDKVILLDVNSIVPSKWQPRKKFDEQKLYQLAESIKQSGIIEPLIVSPLDENKYEIVCGERRWRAAQIANLTEVPVIIKDLDDKQKHLLSLIENLQREDLTPVEEAQAYKSLIQEYNLTQEELAQLLGKDRAVVANTIRILNLPKEIIDYIEDGLISAGHARSLASIKDQDLVIEIANKIIQDKLTVRDVENIVKILKSKKVVNKKVVKEIAEVKSLQKELSELLGCKVVIRPTTDTKGKIIISYDNLDKFDEIMKKLKR